MTIGNSGSEGLTAPNNHKAWGGMGGNLLPLVFKGQELMPNNPKVKVRKELVLMRGLMGRIALILLGIISSFWAAGSMADRYACPNGLDNNEALQIFSDAIASSEHKFAGFKNAGNSNYQTTYGVHTRGHASEAELLELMMRVNSMLRYGIKYQLGSKAGKVKSYPFYLYLFNDEDVRTQSYATHLARGFEILKPPSGCEIERGNDGSLHAVALITASDGRVNNFGELASCPIRAVLFDVGFVGIESVDVNVIFTEQLGVDKVKSYVLREDVVYWLLRMSSKYGNTNINKQDLIEKLDVYLTEECG